MNDTLNTLIRQPSIESEWVTHNPSIARMMQDAASFFVHRADDDLTYAHVAAYKGIEKRLNKKDCLGKPAAYIDGEISDLRIHHIKRAIASGDFVTYSYTHHWAELDWHFDVSVQYLPEHQEVIVQVADGDPFQQQWWHQYQKDAISKRR